MDLSTLVASGATGEWSSPSILALPKAGQNPVVLDQGLITEDHLGTQGAHDLTYNIEP